MYLLAARCMGRNSPARYRISSRTCQTRNHIEFRNRRRGSTEGRGIKTMVAADQIRRDFTTYGQLLLFKPVRNNVRVNPRS